MPAVYAVDLIAKRDRKLKMDRSIVKGWNVHYETLEEVEKAARLKEEKLEKEQMEKERQEQEARETEEEDGKPQQEETGNPENSENAYNRKTRSYSGHYGKNPVADGSEKQQIDAILSEKKDAFHAHLSELQAQGDSGQPIE